MWSKEEFQAWKARPETQKFLAHLREVREGVKEQWAQGNPLEETDRAMAIVYGDILDLDWSRDVAPFYGIEEEDNDAGE